MLVAKVYGEYLYSIYIKVYFYSIFVGGGFIIKKSRVWSRVGEEGEAKHFLYYLSLPHRLKLLLKILT